MASRSISAAAILLACQAFAQPQNVPPKISGTPQLLGHTSDPGFATGNPNVPNDPGYYSDGGAGGTVNGYHLFTLSDGRTITNGGEDIVHTNYAFTTGSDPTNITILGNYNLNPPFYLSVPDSNSGVIGPEDGDACSGNSFAPAPNTMMVQLPNTTTGINVWSVYCIPNVQYNTLIEYDVQDLEGLAANSQNIPATRTVQQLFQADQPLYGTDGIAVDDEYIYLVARNDSSFFLARVEQGSRTDLSQYEYWSPPANAWTSNIPSPNDGTEAFFEGYNPGSGVQFGSDLFWSPYFNTWMLSYSSNSFGAGIYNLAYSTSGHVTGPYEDVHGFYGPPIDAGCETNSPDYNPATQGSFAVVYLTHSHPGFDPTGQTMMVGWISCNTYTNFALITFQ